MLRDQELEEREARRDRRVGEFLSSLAQGAGTGGLEGGVLVSWRVRMPTEEDPGALLVVRADVASGPFVAFVGGYRAADVVLAWRKRSLAGRMKWREDEPWQGPGA